MYRKPRDSDSTSSLYITGKSIRLSDGSEILKQLESKYLCSVVNHDFKLLKENRMYLTFSTVAEACNIKEKCKFILGSNVFIQFANYMSYEELMMVEIKRQSAMLEDVSRTKSRLIDGCILYENFITEDEESLLLQSIYRQKWLTTIKSRRVQHYGHNFNYKTRKSDVSLGEKLPNWSNSIIDRARSMSLFKNIPNQMTINEYIPGKGIAAHVDTHSAFLNEISSLSLQSNIVMRFDSLDGTHKNLYLPRRSLLVMSGEARYAWMHSIAGRKTDLVEGVLHNRDTRVSLTFRNVPEEAFICNCGFPQLCDSQYNKIKEIPDRIRWKCGITMDPS